MAENTGKSINMKYIIIGALVLIGVLIGYLFFSQNKSSAEPSSISGTIDYNGLKPTGEEDEDLVKIKLLTRPFGESSDFEEIDVPVALEDRAKWEWDKAEQGKTYEIVSEITYKDQLVKRSSRVTATAPAEGLVLIFNITEDDIDQFRDTANEPELSTVSGTVIINGFIPGGSTVNVYGRKAGTSNQFTEVISGVRASSRVSIEYKEAIHGETYEYQAELYDSTGTFIGQSQYLTVTAPASNEIVVINSTASAPSQKATISGNISLSGNLEQNSTVLLLQRKIGDRDYSVINRFPANRSINFEWKDANQGTIYEITAALQVNEQNTATGNVITVSAPATNVNLRIDTNFQLNPPTQTPRITCGSPDGTNHFNVRIDVPQESNARRYHLQLGTSAGASNVLNTSLNPNQTATAYIPANSPHFTRYAYTSCTDCEINDPTNWSGWSPTLGFSCPQ